MYLFLLKKLNNFVSFITPVVEKWHIHMKKLVATPTLLVLSLVLFIVDHVTAQIEVVRKSLNPVASYRGVTAVTQQYICIWACQSSQWLYSEYLSLSCLSTTVVNQKHFPIEQNLKGHPSRWIQVFLKLLFGCPSENFGSFPREQPH